MPCPFSCFPSSHAPPSPQCPPTPFVLLTLRLFSTLPVTSRYRFTGDTFRNSTPDAAAELRVWYHNVDCLPTSLHFAEELEEIVASDVDVIILADIRWSDHTRLGVLDMLRNKWAKEFWHSEWFNKHKDAPTHGMFLAVRDPLRRYIETDITDSRGWARYAGVVLRHNDRALSIFGVYACPFSDCAEHRWETDRIKNLPANEASLTPYDLLRRDLDQELVTQAAAKTPAILLGDWNVTWSPAARLNEMSSTYQKNHYAPWHYWFGRSEDDPLVNAFYHRGHPATPTFSRSNTANDMDFAVANASFLRASLTRCGVLVGDEPGVAPPSSSEHCPIAVGLDLTAVFGCDLFKSTVRTKELHPTAFAVRSGDENAAERYASLVGQHWDKAVISHRLIAINVAPDTEESRQQLESLYHDAVCCMTTAAADFHAEKRRLFRERMGTKAHEATFGNRVKRDVLRGIYQVTGKVGAGKRARTLHRLERCHAMTLQDLDINISEIRQLLDDAAHAHDLGSRVAAADATEQLRLLRAKWHLELSRLDRQHLQAVQKAQREELARRAEATGPDGRVQQRQLVDVVLARERRVGGKYASVVTQNDDSTRTVHTTPENVARTLVGCFDRWMGGAGRRFWYDGTDLDADTPSGQALRRHLADHGAAGLDFDAARIPEKFAPVLHHMKRLEVASSANYASIYNPLTKEDWKAYWRSRKYGKAPGLSGVTVELVRLLPDSLQDDLLQIINLAHRWKYLFKSWKDRCLVPIPKVQGSVKLSDARPLSLLDTISKAYWGMIFKRITPEWERLGFFNDQQFGSRRGTSVVTPLTIATALSELAYADHVPFLAISQDISKAYDSVPIRLGVEVALRRFGLPEDFIVHYLNSHRGNRAVIATAYGASDSVLGVADGTFSFTRGVPQGATESPFCWIAFYSILMAMQSDETLVPEGCLELTGACLRRPDPARGRPIVAASKRTSGLCFVDDALWYSNTRRGVEMRLAVCSLFFEFFAVQFNVTKTKALGLEWFKGPLDIAYNEWTPWIYDTDRLFAGGTLVYDRIDADHIGPSAARVGEIGVVPLWQGARYLGVQWSPATAHVNTTTGLRAIVDDFLGKVRAVPIGADSTRYLVDQVLFPKLQFKLRFERFDEETIDKLQRDVTTLLLERAKLNPRINHRVLQAPPQSGGMGWPRWVDRIYADRLECCETILRRDDLASKLILALIRQCQERFASSTPVFESPLAANSKYLDKRNASNVRFGWIEGLVVWATTNNVAFVGAAPLGGAATTEDRTLVDLAVAAGHAADDISRLRRACHESDTYWASSFLSSSGTFHGANHVPTSTYNRQLLASTARRLIPGLDLGAPIAGVHRGDVSVCEIDGQLRLVEISDTDDDVAIVRELARYERQTEATAGVAARRRFADVWYDGTIEIVFDDGSLLFESCGERAMLNGRDVRNLRYFRTVPFALTDEFTRTTQFVVGLKDVLVPLPGLRRLPLIRPRADGEFHREAFQLDLDALDDAGDVYCARRAIAAAASALPPARPAPVSAAEVDAELRALGVASYDATVMSRFPEWSDLDALRARTPSAMPSRRSISIATDGSEAFGVGGAGAVLYDPRNERLYCACVQVTSGPGILSSYRAELFGLHLALILTWTLRHRLPRLPLAVVLDNSGAVQAFHRLRERLPSTSQDVWDEIYYYAKRLGMSFGLDVSWQRGHPEKQKPSNQFTFFESLQHLSDGLADAGRRGHGATDPSSRFTHARRWFVSYDGRRIFDKPTAALLHQIGLARLRGYDKFVPPTSPLDNWIRSTYCGYSKDVFSRAMTTKFILEQLATQERAAAWHYPVDNHRCRLCCVDGTHETLRHLLLDCSSPQLCDIRRKYVVSMVAGVHLQSPPFASFLHDYFQLDACTRLRCLIDPASNDEAAAVLAYDFVRGIWSPSLIDAFFQLAPVGMDSLEWFSRLVPSFSRAARTHLWRPVWNVWHSAMITTISSSSAE